MASKRVLSPSIAKGSEFQRKEPHRAGVPDPQVGSDFKVHGSADRGLIPDVATCAQVIAGRHDIELQTICSGRWPRMRVGSFLVVAKAQMKAVWPICAA